MKKFVGLILVGLIILLSFSISCKTEETEVIPTEEKKIKAGFIYVGPIGDFGWSHAHEQGRKYVAEKFPWLETIYVEAVAEADCPRIIDRLINEEKCDIVFTTSFGYMDATVEAAKKYPDKLFMHCSGYKLDKNLGTYFIDFYELYYLNGLMAGALTKSNKIGYVGAQPTPEVVRHINAFALGIKESNPNAKVYVTWINSWYDPAKAKEAAESLIAQGVDTLAFTEDSTATVEVGQDYTKKGKQIYTFSHYSPMLKYGEDSVVSGQLVNWGIAYEEILMRLYTNTWISKDYLYFLKEGGCELGGDFGVPINPKFENDLKNKKIKDKLLGEISIYDLVMKRIEQFKDPVAKYNPFVGPLYDNKGNLKLKEGEEGTYNMLWSIDWFVDNVVGEIPK